MNLGYFHGGSLDEQDRVDSAKIVAGRLRHDEAWRVLLSTGEIYVEDKVYNYEIHWRLVEGDEKTEVLLTTDWRPVV